MFVSEDTGEESRPSWTTDGGLILRSDRGTSCLHVPIGKTSGRELRDLGNRSFVDDLAQNIASTPIDADDEDAPPAEGTLLAGTRCLD